MSRQWFKLWPREWIYGDLRSELTIEERALWTDLLAMAALSPEDGVVCESKRNGYSVPRLAAILNFSPAFLTETIEKLSGNRLKMITVLKRNRIKIRNWRRFQSDYCRQRSYRQKLQPELQEELHQKLHPRSKKEEIEVEDRKEKVRKEESKPACLPTSGPPKTETTEEIGTALDIVWSISGWPRDETVDAVLLKTLVVDYPEIDLIPAVRAFHAYCIDKPLGKKSRPRLRLTNWFQTSRKFGQNIRAVKVAIDSSATDLAAKREVERLERRLELERSRETEAGMGQGSREGQDTGEQPNGPVEDNRASAGCGNAGGQGRYGDELRMPALQRLSLGVPEDDTRRGGGFQPIAGSGLLGRLAGGSTENKGSPDNEAV
jgi:hypothetical protein